MPIELNTDFVGLLKSKGMNGKPFDKFIDMGVQIKVGMYSITAIYGSKEVAKASSQNVSVQKCLPNLAGQLLTKLETWASTSPSQPAQKPGYGVTITPDAKPAASGAGKPKTLEELAAKAAKASSTPALDLLKPIGGQAMSVAPNPGGYMVYSPDTAQAPIHLRHAHGLYRRVRGSGNNSVYFLLADFGQLKMAGRWQGQAFSVRFEAENISPYSALMQSMGLNVSGVHHASVHATVNSKIDARKLVYAMIGAVEGTLLSPMPDPSLIKDKGQ